MNNSRNIPFIVAMLVRRHGWQYPAHAYQVGSPFLLSTENHNPNPYVCELCFILFSLETNNPTHHLCSSPKMNERNLLLVERIKKNCPRVKSSTRLFFCLQMLPCLEEETSLLQIHTYIHAYMDACMHTCMNASRYPSSHLCTYSCA